MKTAHFYQDTADALGVALYLYPDGSVTNSRKAGVEPTATIEPHEHIPLFRTNAAWSRTEQPLGGSEFLTSSVA